jgi:hypothetical protein
LLVVHVIPGLPSGCRLDAFGGEGWEADDSSSRTLLFTRPGPVEAGTDLPIIWVQMWCEVARLPRAYQLILSVDVYAENDVNPANNSDWDFVTVSIEG